jgi:hypothetical protein
MLQNSLNTSKGLDHIGSVVIQIPELSVVLLMCPPERILLQELILLEVLPYSPSFVISESQSVLLEKSIDPWNTMIPSLLQIIQC